MLGAGKKDPVKNTFSGVLIGDIGQASESGSVSTGELGVYGLHDGELSYSLKVDGTTKDQIAISMVWGSF
jgi:hypothetical protein